MTPEQVSMINAVSMILDKIGTLPIGGLVLLIIAGPWVSLFLLSRGYEKRFESVVAMYENNVKLVEGYETLAKSLQDLVLYNTQTMTRVDEKIDKNLYCPMVRKETRPMYKEVEG